MTVLRATVLLDQPFLHWLTVTRTPDAFQQLRRRFVVGVLRHQLAFERALEDGLAQAFGAQNVAVGPKALDNGGGLVRAQDLGSSSASSDSGAAIRSCTAISGT